ncbi:MAG: ammonium transporter, partial [Nitrososphaerota archaeon]|nr:ammonium transporter [Nitrososphaerota archaeon]
MTPSVGLFELGELGDEFERTSLLKVMLIVGIGLIVMAAVGFNTAFAPTVAGGLIGNPLYGAGLFLGGDSANAAGLLSGVFWSMTPKYFGAGLTTGTYFIFETAFAMVTLALVGLVVLKKVKLEAFALFSVVYLVVIWNVPAAWIWNPTGWLYSMGMRDFAGGLVVHGAAGVAGLGILLEIWLEERKAGLKESAQVPITIDSSRLTLSTVLLWVGWFGFNPGSVLEFDSSATVVVVTTFLAAAACFVSLILVAY